MKVPNKETLRPFDKVEVPVPKQVQNMPGFKEYARMQRTTSKPEDLKNLQMEIVNDPETEK